MTDSHKKLGKDEGSADLKKYILIVFYRTKSVDIYTILVYNVLEMRFSSTWTHKIDKNSTVQVLRIISR